MGDESCRFRSQSALVQYESGLGWVHLTSVSECEVDGALERLHTDSWENMIFLYRSTTLERRGDGDTTCLPDVVAITADVNSKVDGCRTSGVSPACAQKNVRASQCQWLSAVLKLNQ